MKAILILLLLPTMCFAQKKVNWGQITNGNSIATYSLMFAGGFSDGMNDCVIANKFYYAPFWGYSDWMKHGNMDGFHISKGATYVFYSAAVAINFGDKQNWKTIVTKGLISLAASRLGHEVCYNIIFKNYPK
jgi:hypothetical protein